MIDQATLVTDRATFYRFACRCGYRTVVIGTADHQESAFVEAFATAHKRVCRRPRSMWTHGPITADVARAELRDTIRARRRISA